MSRELEDVAVPEATECGAVDIGKAVNCQASEGGNAPTASAEAICLVVEPVPVRTAREHVNAANPSASRAVDFSHAVHSQFSLRNRVVVPTSKGMDEGFGPYTIGR